MLVEALVFSLLSGSAALLGNYRVFTRSTSTDGTRAKVLQTTFLGLVPAVVGFILAVPSLETGDSAAYAVFLTFAAVFLVAFALRFSISAGFTVGWYAGVVAPYSLIGAIASISSAHRPDTSPAAVCLVYLSLYYFWVFDFGDDNPRYSRLLNFDG